MKRLLLFPLMALLMTASVSCDDDDDNNNNSSQNPTDVINTVTSGTWRITSYIEDNIDQTSNFTGYDFTFGSNQVLTATNGTDTHEGVWSVTTEDDDDSPNDVDFNIGFASPPNFAELTEDWDIIERTNTKIRLRDESGDGSIDTLTFEKN